MIKSRIKSRPESRHVLMNWHFKNGNLECSNEMLISKWHYWNGDLQWIIYLRKFHKERLELGKLSNFHIKIKLFTANSLRLIPLYSFRNTNQIRQDNKNQSKHNGENKPVKLNQQDLVRSEGQIDD